jgi:hypothetical protein
MTSHNYKLVLPPTPAFTGANWESELDTWRNTWTEQRRALESRGVMFHESLSQTETPRAYRVSIPEEHVASIQAINKVMSCEPYYPELVMRPHNETDIVLWIIQLEPSRHVQIRDWLSQRNLQILPAMQPSLAEIRCLAPVKIIRELREVPGIQGIEEWIPVTLHQTK